jgi:predicted secreted protein with PEFG-CTERM motif
VFKLAIITLAAILLIPVVSNVFAASNIEVIIATGSSSPKSNLWFSPPETNANVGDTIEISNGDTVPHEIVSGTPDSGPDEKFDTGTLNPGLSFSYLVTSKDVGTLHFYDKNYPWMVGNILVQSTPTGYKVFRGVGHDVGDGKTTFDVQYQSIKDIIGASVGQKDHSLNFILVGKTNQSSNLVLRLPNALIMPPFLGIQRDGQFINDFTISQEPGLNVITVPITPLSEQVSVVGSAVVPEFGPVAVLVLAISIVTIVLFTKFRPIHRLE